MTLEQEPEGADLDAAHCKPSVLQYCKRPSTFKLPEETYRVHDNDAGPQARCVWMCSTIYPGLTQELEDQGPRGRMSAAVLPPSLGGRTQSRQATPSSYARATQQRKSRHAAQSAICR